MGRAILAMLATSAIAFTAAPAAATPAPAGITECTSGTSCISGTTTVKLDTTTGTTNTVTGHVGVGGSLVTFTGDENLNTNPGAATIFPTDLSTLTTLTFTIVGGFTKAEFNLENGDPTSFTVSLTDSAGDTFSQLLTKLNGSNIFDIVAAPGVTLTSATFTTSGGGFNDFKQLRVVTATSIPDVPEPATWGLMLLGFGGIGMAMRRSRRNSKMLMQVA
jgi:hypothetical protein